MPADLIAAGEERLDHLQRRWWTGRRPGSGVSWRAFCDARRPPRGQARPHDPPLRGRRPRAPGGDAVGVDEARDLVMATAARLGVSPRALDYAIWATRAAADRHTPTCRRTAPFRQVEMCRPGAGRDRFGDFVPAGVPWAGSRWRAGPVGGHGLRLRKLRLRSVSRRHPPEHRLCPAGRHRPRRGPPASTPSRPQLLRRARAHRSPPKCQRDRGLPPRWRANGCAAGSPKQRRAARAITGGCRPRGRCFHARRSGCRADQPPIKRLVLLRLSARSQSQKMPPHASFVGADRRSCWHRLGGRRGSPASASPASSYRSVRGSPNWGKTLVSANQVIADIWSPSSVRTNSPRRPRDVGMWDWAGSTRRRAGRSHGSAPAAAVRRAGPRGRVGTRRSRWGPGTPRARAASSARRRR